MANRLLKEFLRLRREKLRGMRMAHDACQEIREEYTPKEEDLEIIDLLDNIIQKMTSNRGIQR